MIPTVLLVDDHTLVRAGIRKLLDESYEVQVIGEFGNARDALDLCGQEKPDVVLTDVDMPEVSGVELTRQISASYPASAVIMLSMHKSPQYVIESLRAGAKGYVIKDSAITELLTAIRTVVAGGRFLSPALSANAIEDRMNRANDGGSASDLGMLSSREREVLKLLAEGNTAKQIRAMLFISESTVDAHRWNIMKKLDIHSMAGLTRFAIVNGLTSTG